MPVLVDDEPLGGGLPISVFESGAILFYPAEKTGKFWPQEPHKKYEVVQWVVWQMANQGPKAKLLYISAPAQWFTARTRVSELSYGPRRVLRRFLPAVQRRSGPTGHTGGTLGRYPRLPSEATPRNRRAAFPSL
jgi:glutathione S-transferase